MHWLLLCELLNFFPLSLLCANKSRALNQQQEMQYVTPSLIEDSFFFFKYKVENKKGLCQRYLFASREMSLCLHTAVTLTVLPDSQRSGAILLWSDSKESK